MTTVSRSTGFPSGRHRLLRLAAGIVSTAGVLAVTIVNVLPAEAAGFLQAVEVLSPSNAASDPLANLSAISCTSAGNCTGAGYYYDTSGNYQPMAATEFNGTWAQAVQLTLPMNAGSPAFPILSGVSCTSIGNCVAVGSYVDDLDETEMMAMSQSGGSWSNGVELTPPSTASNPANPYLTGVSCPSAGNCMAVGSYADASGSPQAMAVPESAGTWQQAVEVAAPAGAGAYPYAFLNGVSCTSIGTCAAVGYYEDNSGYQQVMAAAEGGGSWGQAVRVALPANAGAPTNPSLYGVSCTSAGNCSAAGWYQDRSGNQQAMTATESAGQWAQAIEVTPPSNAGSPAQPTLVGVSCSSAANCVAVGYYIDGSGQGQAMAETESSGSWSPAVEVTPPSNGGRSAGPNLQGISCVSIGSCVAVGSYIDDSGSYQGWAASTSLPLPTAADQCKKDAWQTYGVFKTQGDCVSYVETGGHNPPG